MATQVTVVDPSFRRQVIKVMPGTYLSDVLQEACSKLRLNPAQYRLRHKDKALDLSRTFRLSGLTSGAKLELVLLSRSPTVVSVALQLPASEAPSPTASAPRLVDKVPSTTTLWQVLRMFEFGVAGGAAAARRNLTGRGIPRTQGAGTGAGRLYHEQPVLQILGREYTSFDDLQKTLAQIGLDSGSVLLKLEFRPSDVPLEEALDQTQKYFQDESTPASNQTKTPVEDKPSLPSEQKSEPPSNPMGSVPPPSTSDTNHATSHLGPSPSDAPSSNGQATLPSTSANDSSKPPEPAGADAGQAAATTPPVSTTDISGRPSVVYAAPDSTTPQAAATQYNPSDYVPTVDHAKLHQARLAASTVNRRLPSDAEITAQETARADALASTTSIEIKLRLPDQSSVVSRFGPSDTTESLYQYVTSLLAQPEEPFLLTLAGPRGAHRLSRNADRRLIRDEQLTGKVLVTMSWAANASVASRQGAVLRAELASQAQALKVQEPSAVIAGADQDTNVQAVVPTAEDKGKEKTRGQGGMPKWFKMPGQK